MATGDADSGLTGLQAVFQEAALAVIILDMEGLILSANHALCQLTGYSPDDLVGQPMTCLLGNEHQADVARILEQLDSGTKACRVERRLVRRDGESLFVRNNVTTLDQAGTPKQLLVLVEQISEWQQTTEKLQYQVAHEEITGLYNRRHFEELLGKAIADGARADGKLALLYLDLDGFKLVNDTMGHAVGDQLLREVGVGLTQCVDPADVLARLGGDEFAVFRPGGGPQDATELAAKMLEIFTRPFAASTHELRIGCSIGAVTMPADGATAGELMQHADAAMYSAKQQGRNRCATFTADLRRRATDRLAIETQIRNALAADQFHLEFQSIQETKEQELVRFEAVCRWQNPVLGNVSPMQFIPVAEETGIIIELGKFVLRQACAAAAGWAGQSMQAGVAVNISNVEFSRADFAETVRQALENSRLTPSLLELEVNEGVMADDIEGSIAKVSRLREMGVRVTLDNFGTGSSSLSYLRRLPVSALKIDRTFVADLQTGPGAVSLVRSIIGIANSFGLRVLADGVENDAQLRVLRFLGCSEVQGFYFGKPEPLAVATARLREKRSSSTARVSDWMAANRAANRPRRQA